MRIASLLHIVILLAVVVGLASCKRNAASLPTPHVRQDESSEWKLVWADEFDIDGPPSAANWTSEIGFVRNEELQWYQPDNATCENGMLVLTARRERLDIPHHEPAAPEWAKSRTHADYTSASLTTKDLHQWLYGRFVMRARIDTRAGLWPAFWTLGVTGDWPHCGEIDIMEYYRGILLANAFWGSKEKGGPLSSLNRLPLEQFNDPAWSDRFHVWRMDWDEQQIQVFIDDRPLCRIDLDQTNNEDPSGVNPLRQPHYLLLSLAIGGTQGGDPTATEFPAKFEIDYVRVFRRKAELQRTPNGESATRRTTVLPKF
jgi:beta-glucanase (GH16 family)